MAEADSLIFTSFGFLLRKHHHTIYKIGDPLLREAKATVILTNRNDGLQDVGLLEIVLIENVTDSLLCHRVKCLFHETRQTELEFHQISRQHHDVLRKALKLEKVGLCILHFLTAAVQALVYLLEEGIVHRIHRLKHILAAATLADT